MDFIFGVSLLFMISAFGLITLHTRNNTWKICNGSICYRNKSQIKGWYTTGMDSSFHPFTELNLNSFKLTVLKDYIFK